MAKKHEEITGEFDYIVRKYPANDGQIKILPGLLIDGTKVVGYCLEEELQTGLTYLFRGFWQIYKNEKQFHFYSFGISQPAGQRGTVAYLTHGPGIGSKRAKQIWETFGPGSLEAIRTKPDEVAAAVKGLTPEKARAAAAWFQSHVDREIVTRDLEELLSGGGFPRNLIEKLIERWGAKAAEVIKANPYCLMSFPYVGFGKADKLYLALGGDPATPERLAWAAWNALHKDREGHTWCPASVGHQAIAKCISGVEVDSAAGIAWGIEKHHIAARRDGGQTWISEDRRAEAEARLANHVYRAMVEGNDEENANPGTAAACQPGAATCMEAAKINV